MNHTNHTIPKSMLLLLLVLMVAILMANALIQLPFRIQRDYNEGWNAYQAQHVFSDDELYPDPSALTTNNYPPLSYIIVGALATFSDDHITMGRVTALLSLLITSFLIGVIIYATINSLFWAAFSSLLFLGYAAAMFEAYIAMNDPQWLGHALQILGLFFFVKHNSHRSTIYVSSFLLVLSGFVKHTLIPLPLALTLWLLFYRREMFMHWLVASAISIMALFIAFGFLFGANFLSAIFRDARVYLLSEIMTKSGRWLLPMLGLILVSLSSVNFFRDRKDIRLFQFYAALSLLFGVFIACGRGVDQNAFFDTLIAFCLLGGCTLYKISISGNNTRRHHAVLGIVVGMTLLPCLWSVSSRINDTYVTLHTINEKEKAVAQQIDMIASSKGPVMCEDLALCYWAGKSFEVDFFNTGQKIRAQLINPGLLEQRIKDHYFDIIQLTNHKGQTYRLTQSLNKSITENYHQFHESKALGILLKPTEKS